MFLVYPRMILVKKMAMFSQDQLLSLARFTLSMIFSLTFFCLFGKNVLVNSVSDGKGKVHSEIQNLIIRMQSSLEHFDRSDFKSLPYI